MEPVESFILLVSQRPNLKNPSNSSNSAHPLRAVGVEPLVRLGFPEISYLTKAFTLKELEEVLEYAKSGQLYAALYLTTDEVHQLVLSLEELISWLKNLNLQLQNLTHAHEKHL